MTALIMFVLGWINLVIIAKILKIGEQIGAVPGIAVIHHFSKSAVNEDDLSVDEVLEKRRERR